MSTQTIGQVQTTYKGKTYTGPAAIAAEVLAQGGTTAQAYAAAALVSGIETGPSDPVNIANYGSSGAEGLFQFEPGTWVGNGGSAYAPTAGGATWQQQVTVFLNATSGGNYGDWRPDFVPGLDPNATSSYGPSVSGPQPGSRVAQVLATLTSETPSPVADLLGNVPAKWADVGGATPSNPAPGVAGDIAGLATGGTIPGDLQNAAGGVFGGIEAVGNFFNLVVSGFGIGWHAVLTIIGGALLIIIALFILFRHQAEDTAERVAPAAAVAAA